MTRNLEPIPPDVHLDDAVHDYLLRQGQRALPVTSGTQLLGILSITDVHHSAQGQWPVIAVGRAMIPVERVESVAPTMPVADALRLMTTHRRYELPVLDDGHLVGLLTQSGVITYFQLRRELGVSMPRQEREVAGPRSAYHRPLPD